MYNLAILSEKGAGVKQDLRVAENIYRLAAGRGNQKAAAAATGLHNEEESRQAMQSANASKEKNSSNTTIRRTCARCNGSGKITDRSISETRDWSRSTITFTGHFTTRSCMWCDGTGHLSF